MVAFLDGGNMKIQYKNSENGHEIFEVQVPKMSTRYLDWAWRLKCLPDLHQLGVFPNVKEITESMAGYRAVSQGLQLSPGDKDTLLLCVGDGKYPRTGVLCAHMSRWTCISIDPAMKKIESKINSIVHNVERLNCYPRRIENLGKIKANPDKRFVILHVHSHAKLSNSLLALKLHENQRVDIVSMPCCEPDDLGIAPDITYCDHGILSPQRTVNIYKYESLVKKGVL